MNLSARAGPARPSVLRRRRVRTALAVSVTVLGLLLIAALRPQSSTAVPVEGHTGWSFLMCKYKGNNTEPQNRQFYEQFLTDAGIGRNGVVDYFAEVSGGRIDLRGSVLHGWYTMDVTRATANARTSNRRASFIDDCVRAAKTGGYTVPSGDRVLATVNEQIDSGSAGGRVLLDPLALTQSFATHEMLHAYGLGHSYSNDTSYQNATWSQPGEYDNKWDQMSALNNYSWQTSLFGQSAVGLNAYHRDKLGWLARDRVVTYGTNPVAANTFTLTALEGQALPGKLLVRVPVDSSPDHYYTVEYRRKMGVSAGIPNDTVLISEVKGGISYLQRDLSAPGRPPSYFVRANGVSIQVVRTSAADIDVRITSDAVDGCRSGYVWREADPADRVCVTPDLRTQAGQDNAARAGRWVSGPSGAHTCIAGYVWREAFAGDDVCVTPDRRTRAATDNAAAASHRVATDYSALALGPNRCKSGYVWREVDNRDYVCVPSTTKSQVIADNAAAASRWTHGTSGPHTCIDGYVWREAFPADDVCVVKSRRDQAAKDNQTAGDRVANANA